ncbi:peptidase S41 family protein [Westerdykella ornata]|uniref:Peptidase S41 family protein n=1 Tax=Westerdykella ornata TaxID=318751 RepID=A0A6A6J7U7_WESOR|nr:peptidase S41 family protein [Westerdykella ornata]KAF2272631.1 peptidase S41 family protein [Westerdykella ornata]
MRALITVPLLAALAAALPQLETFSIRPIETEEPATSVDRIEPTATPTDIGPIETARACSQLSFLISESEEDYPIVDADLAYACLQTVPIDKSRASTTIKSIKQMIEYQSTLKYLADPPSGYFNPAVDLVAGLDDIGQKVESGDYANEFDFEQDIAALLGKGYDGHLGFDGMTFSGAIRWRRSTRAALAAASSDGKDAPKVWAIQDFNSTDKEEGKRSAVTQINGKDVVQFLEEEAANVPYHDPDVRFNAMLYQLPAQMSGNFINPPFYPGPVTNLTFENGTTQTFLNSALVTDRDSWSDISNGKDFYDVFVRYQRNIFKLKKRSTTHKLPHRLRLPKEADIGIEAVVPFNYPEPAFQHQSPDVPLGGYYIETDIGTIGVLSIQTFETEPDSAAEEFQSVVQNYIAESLNRKVTRHIIDIRSNPGGLVMHGLDTYLQFFPSQNPQNLGRYRATEAVNIIGEQIGKLPLDSSTIEIYANPFNFNPYLDRNEKPFPSWKAMYGPQTFHSDTFTNLWRYNLSDPLVTSSDRFSIGITMTGFADRSNFTTDPFKAEDLVILTDGLCASTCALFAELMTQQSGVRTLALGGRPTVPGPMQTVGGTKGSLVLRYEQLSAYAQFVIATFAETSTQRREWSAALPQYEGIAYAEGGAAVNFADSIRWGLEKDGVPTQFLNDSASCRVWYRVEEYLDVRALWRRMARVAWGGKGVGGLDEGECVEGSVTSREQQTGLGPGTPTSHDGGGGEGKPKKKGEAGRRFGSGEGAWTAVVVFLSVWLLLGV